MTALAYWYTRTAKGDAPPSIAPLSRWDAVRLLEYWLEKMPGLTRFLFQGTLELGSQTVNALLSPWRK